MNTAPTGLDSLAAVLIIILGLFSLLTLLGMASLMAIGAVTRRPLVTSWPSNQEQAFEPFEQSAAMSNSRAWGYSLFGAALLTLFACFVYFGVTPEKKDFAKDMNMSNLTKKRGPAAPKPDPVKSDSEAPKADTPAPAEAPKAESSDPAPSESSK
jgi:hypothetical protein